MRSGPMLAYDSSALSAPERARRLREDSFLFFRCLLDPAEVSDVRHAVLDALHRVGWLAPGADPAQALPGGQVHHDRGLRAGRAVADPDWPVGYRAVQSLEALHRLAHSAALVTTVEELFGTPVLVHPRKIARLSFPGSNFPTPPHQDALFNEVPADVLTAWIPLGDCPAELGPLQALRGSANLGVLPVSAHDGLGGEAVEPPSELQEWVGDDYRSGDVMLFHSRTVHRTTPNVGATLRLSIDCRYQSAQDPIKLAALLPHGHGSGHLPGWRELTRGWSTTRWVEPGRPVEVRVAACTSDRAASRLVRRNPGRIEATR